MIVLLKTCAITGLCGKIYLDAIMDNFFPVCGLQLGEGHGYMKEREGDFAFWSETEVKVGDDV